MPEAAMRMAWAIQLPQELIDKLLVQAAAFLNLFAKLRLEETHFLGGNPLLSHSLATQDFVYDRFFIGYGFFGHWRFL